MTLIDRLSKLDGPNRRMDHEMHILFFVPDDKKDTVEWNHFGSYSWSPSPDHVMIDKVPVYTASVDAAIALAERVLPGYSRIIWEHPGECHVDMFKLGELQKLPDGRLHKDRYNLVQVEQAPTLAIALCIAILRAKEASE